MHEEILHLLQESNERLLQMQSEITEIIKKNDSAIAEIQSLLIEKLEPTESKGSTSDGDTNLMSIQQLWEERSFSRPLVIQKSKWTNGFCFSVHSLENNTAHGISYVRNTDGTISIESETRHYPCDKLWFSLLPDEAADLWEYISISESVIQEDEENNTEKVPHLRIPESHFENEQDEYTEEGNPIEIGSTVTVRNLATGNEYTFRIVPSYEIQHYLTMGYHTRNYVEFTTVSDADGKDTISDSCPLGKSLLGKYKGSKVAYSVITTFETYHHEYRVLDVIDPA